MVLAPTPVLVGRPGLHLRAELRVVVHLQSRLGDLRTCPLPSSLPGWAAGVFAVVGEEMGSTGVTFGTGNPGPWVHDPEGSHLRVRG